MLNKEDVTIIRELAGEVAEVAALPVQEEKREMWRRLNGLDPVRPMVMIDQVCWNEMDTDGEMALRCTDQECYWYEWGLRATLYQWKHFPVDKVVEPFIHVGKAIHNSGFGMTVQEQIAVSDPTSGVVGHKYENQFLTDDDIEKIKMPRIGHDLAETERRLSVAHELFDGLLDVRPQGADPSYMSVWDPLSMWMGVENALYTLVDKPDFMHRIVGRMTDSRLCALDQLEQQGLLCEPQTGVHCTGAYTNDLPAPGYAPEAPRAKDLWMFGMAQMFSSVSPAMFKEFEVDYVSRIAERFGLVYYGCCEPLDGMMSEVRMIPNVRKISMSPWVDQERGARQIGTDYVFSRKPSPALVAKDTFYPEQVREDLLATRAACEKYGCPLEIILKDISTVRYQPERLFEWARIAMEVVEGMIG